MQDRNANLVEWSLKQTTRTHARARARAPFRAPPEGGGGARFMLRNLLSLILWDEIRRDGRSRYQSNDVKHASLLGRKGIEWFGKRFERRYLEGVHAFSIEDSACSNIIGRISVKYR